MRIYKIGVFNFSFVGWIIFFFGGCFVYFCYLFVRFQQYLFQQWRFKMLLDVNKSFLSSVGLCVGVYICRVGSCYGLRIIDLNLLNYNIVKIIICFVIFIGYIYKYLVDFYIIYFKFVKEFIFVIKLILLEYIRGIVVQSECNVD